MKKLDLHDEAEAELSEIIEYYSTINYDVALKFYQEIADSFSHILRQPKIGTPIEEPYRKFVTARFHYIIIYKESAEGIKVDAIGHYSRKPGYWLDRK